MHHSVCRGLQLGRVASASTTPRFGVWDPCENPGLQPNDRNKAVLWRSLAWQRPWCCMGSQARLWSCSAAARSRRRQGPASISELASMGAEAGSGQPSIKEAPSVGYMGNRALLSTYAKDWWPGQRVSRSGNWRPFTITVM